MLLNCHTYYSFCYGTWDTEELLKAVIAKGHKTFALTDINNTSAVLDMVRLAKEAGVHLAAGIDFRNGTAQKYVGIARNNQGFRELNEHLSPHLHSAEPFAEQAPEFNNAYIIYPLSSYRGWNLRENEYIGVSASDLSKLELLRKLRDTKKCVILQTASFAGKREFNAHRLLRAIDTNTLLSKLPKNEQAGGSEVLLSPEEIRFAFREYPSLIANSEALLADCSIGFIYGKLSNKNLRYYTTDAGTDMALLRTECMNGLPYRYPNPTPEVMKRLEKELDVIGKMDFAAYFLINWDIVRYAQFRNYYYVGRGSGANSLVAYLLRITDVDPIELDLYFERFINLFRNNAPDFDVDFSWTDRDDITRYIFKRFGQSRTALLGAYNTFQHDAVIRELGKVFGLPAGEIDRLQKITNTKETDELGRLVLKYSQLIKGFPSHLSIHSSGILISEEPISTYSGTILPPKGFPTTQFSMIEAEDIGLYKFDILSQRGLGKIKDSLEIIKKNKGDEIDIHDLSRFKQDEEVKVLLREGKTIGCFYVESPAMRMLLSKLHADDYLRLVAASSIIRPGVSRSGMMKGYITRYREPEERVKARNQLPELYDLLDETYGVMVYQEDVIKVAHMFADLSLEESDYLRRGMSWKFRERDAFWRVRDKFFSNCRAKGYADKLVQDIWNQIESFANFAFSKGHSASYAVESYQAMFLKAYYPLEYLVATLNNGGGFYRKELYVHEARMHGAVIKAPCVNMSDALCCIRGNVIHLGLAMVKDLTNDTLEAILSERKENGEFKNLYDFMRRLPQVSLEQLRLLIRAGAFIFTAEGKKELLWEIHSILQPNAVKEPTARLFEPEIKNWKLPQLENSSLDEAFDEIELLGFPLSSPFQLLREKPPSNMLAADLRKHINGYVHIVGLLVSVKPTSTLKKERMYFGTFIDSEGHWIDTVHFPPSARQYPFNGHGCYELKGKVTEEYDFLTLEVNYMKRLPMVDRETQRAPDRAQKIHGEY